MVKSPLSVVLALKEEIYLNQIDQLKQTTMEYLILHNNKKNKVTKPTIKRLSSGSHNHDAETIIIRNGMHDGAIDRITTYACMANV